MPWKELTSPPHPEQHYLWAGYTLKIEWVDVFKLPYHLCDLSTTARFVFALSNKQEGD